MKTHPRVLWLPKGGNGEADYEDAYHWVESSDPRACAFTCAVADGATEAAFSRLWAQLLVEAFCAEALDPQALADSLPPLQDRWRRAVTGAPLPWYAEEKVENGSFATLLGFTAEPGDDAGERGGRWAAIAVGDSCLVQLRRDHVLRAFPLDRADLFTTAPHLVSSNPRYNERAQGDLQWLTGNTWQPGDEFYLMTDAIACWFLQAVERAQKPWRALHMIFSPGRAALFPTWIAELRRAGHLRNDDVTIVRVRMA